MKNASVHEKTSLDCSLHCDSFLGLPYDWSLNIELVKQKETTMEKIGIQRWGHPQRRPDGPHSGKACRAAFEHFDVLRFESSIQTYHEPATQ